jgi:restriction system protein
MMPRQRICTDFIEQGGQMTIPTFDEFMNPMFQALKALGGSGTIEEINEKTFDSMGLAEDVLEAPHTGRGNQTEVAYRIAWARTYLKKYGVLDNSIRGVWSIKENYTSTENLDVRKVLETVRSMYGLATNSSSASDENLENDGIQEPSENEGWREYLKNVLIGMSPAGFERLVQRLLRESGFVQVEITGRSGDGGVDGKGILRLNGLISFHVIFQCKKYSGSVSSPQIRDFRGAMQGRADKGIFITTGVFTRDAVIEASRDGAPPIDLIDGDGLADRLAELEIGLKKVIRTDYEVNKEFFEKI